MATGRILDRLAFRGFGRGGDASNHASAEIKGGCSLLFVPAYEDGEHGPSTFCPGKREGGRRRISRNWRTLLVLTWGPCTGSRPAHRRRAVRQKPWGMALIAAGVFARAPATPTNRICPRRRCRLAASRENPFRHGPCRAGHSEPHRLRRAELAGRRGDGCSDLGGDCRRFRSDFRAFRFANRIRYPDGGGNHPGLSATAAGDCLFRPGFRHSDRCPGRPAVDFILPRVRGQGLSLRIRDFATAPRSLGANRGRGFGDASWPVFCGRPW